MKGTFVFIIFFILLLSCKDSEEQVVPEEEYFVKIESLFQLKGSDKLYKDPYSNVFVYYNYESNDLIGYDIDDEGRLTKGDNIILPNIIDQTDANAIFEIKSEILDKKVTFIIVSNYLKDRISTNSFPNSRSNINLKIISIEN